MHQVRIYKWKIIHKLLPYIWGNAFNIKIRIILGLLLILTTIFINLSIPLILKETIINLDRYELDIKGNYRWTIILLLTYGGIYTLGQIVFKSRQIIFYIVIEKAIRLFSLNIFNHLHNLDLKFHLQKRIGAITNSVEKFQQSLPEIFWSLALFSVPTVTEVILAVTIVFYLYHWIYGLILLSTILIFSFLSIIGVRWTETAQRTYHDNMQNVHSHMVDSLLNYETVRYFNNRKYESIIFDKFLEKLERAATHFHIKVDIIQMMQGTVVGVGLCVLTWKSGHEVMRGTLGVGDFIVINSYLLQFVSPLINFGWIIVQMNKAFTKLEYVMQLLEEKSEIDDLPNAINLNAQPCEILFDKVCFYYQLERLILSDISFCVTPGNTIAIVGTSGSGKTTIARLLFRFYDITKGRILINNHDIRRISQETLQATVGVIPQDTVLFNSSIYENILYGNPNATKDEVEKVIKLAHLEDFISSLPDGYNTLVGERGLKLSGGEKQRVSIARVLLKNPSIFLFDEATSSLDTATEQAIKENLIEVSREATTIIIAHRLSTITHANEIIVLDKGRIVERGKHSELLNFNGIYRKLWQKQINKQEIAMA